MNEEVKKRALSLLDKRDYSRKMLLDKADAGREIDRATKSRGKADRYDD